ncbi:hypothetical protein [Conexibacter sp. SYSU D00693]|uniref:hypothetical protein n=1 Tax=Conexibacter sp. SYSU D00693 TaxID=2812560 RepID=UPI00196BAF83|nr:hypothetical protein [Conexibacter sp. SYSU D00693]
MDRVTLEVIALVLTFVVHVLGAGILVWNLLDGERVDWRGFLNPDGDGGGGAKRKARDPQGPLSPGGLPIPLDDADQSAERFREPGRLADRKARPVRRPAHVPAPAPEREPAERETV